MLLFIIICIIVELASVLGRQMASQTQMKHHLTAAEGRLPLVAGMPASR
jgi:hypothetical protein